MWPLPQGIIGSNKQASVRILDRHGTLLYELRRGDANSPLSTKEIPERFRKAIVAVEDRTFYEHSGVSIRGTARAITQNIEAGKIVSGGSTLTQQLVRSVLHPTKRGYLYKLYEAFLALKTDTVLSKDEILTKYINTAYFGHQAYGLQTAAHTFFGKDPSQLSLAQTAFLAGLPQSPSNYDPFQNFPAALRRMKTVLQAMVDTKVITKEEMDDALAEPLHLAPDVISIRAPHFVMWVLQKLDPQTLPSEVRTTLDLPLQNEIEITVKNHIEKLKDRNVTAGAVVVLDAHTGDILAMVGSADYFDTEHDGAVNVAVSARQPGSALKPFTYALAFMKGDTAATTVADIETQFFTQDGNPYIPRNYDYGYHGLARYRTALANSYNIAAVKVLEKIGVESLLQFLRKTGLTTLTQTAEHYGLALTLGDGEVKLLELTRAYGIFARKGETLHERMLLSDPIKKGEQVLPASVAWLTADIMSDNQARLPEFGEDGPLEFDFPVAAKTGTTRNSRDNWTVGFTPDRIVGVWVGNADNSAMRQTSGVTGAGPIFHDAMLEATRYLPRTWLTKPANIIDRDICMLSGLLPTDDCKQRMTEHFIAGTEPTKFDTIYQRIAIDKRNGLKASENCDATFVEERVFTNFAPELLQWARANRYPLPPREFSPLCAQSTQHQPGESWLEILRPYPNDSYKIDPLIPAVSQQVLLMGQASDDIATADWYVDGKLVSKGTAPAFRSQWLMQEGNHTVELRAKGMVKSVRISVER
ncbi:MAG: penicillin-binding protein 1C [Candidatus Peribacteraceae bacterium]|nr:penicillin-binding protein 1C [Candidatus Peribacteraceae bacterium]